MSIYSLVCGTCGCSYNSKKQWSKFCSVKCRNDHFNGLLKRTYNDKQCCVCFELFTPSRITSVCCSNKCKHKLYHQKRDSLRKRLTRITYDENGYKLCSKCKIYKSPERFYDRSGYKNKFKDGKDYQCIDCCNIKDKQSKSRLPIERKRIYKNNSSRNQINKLSDSYVINSMLQGLRKFGFKSSDIREYPQLIELQKMVIKLSRKIKTTKS